MTPTPHDALFKFTFGDPVHAASALRAILPPAVAQLVDFDSLRLEPGSFVDEQLRDRHSDCLYVARLSGTEVRIYLLFEHQSADHPLMPLRLLEYLARIWRAWLALEENRGKTRLPPILPVVLHHGETGWRAPRTLSAMYDLEPEALAILGHWLPELRFFLDDLASVPVETLEARNLTGLAYLTALSLKLGRTDEDLSQWLARSPDALRDAWQLGGIRALIALIRYIMQVNGAARDDLESVVARALGRPGQEAVMTAAQRLRAEGYEEGREEGREVGRQEGREVGREEALEEALAQARVTFTKLVRARFGAVEAPHLAQIATLDLVQIDQLTERIFVADTVDDLVAALPERLGDADAEPATAVADLAADAD